MVTQQEDFPKKWAKVVAKAWSDPAFKKKLLEHPEATLAAEGLSAPKGVHVEVHENTHKVVHLHLPTKPERALSEDKLHKIQLARSIRLVSLYCAHLGFCEFLSCLFPFGFAFASQAHKEIASSSTQRLRKKCRA